MDEVSLNCCTSSRCDPIPITGNDSIHPLVSSVIYLDDGGSSGAPTLIIDQHLDGHKSNRAWTCNPKTGRLLLFDGRLLHGVVPHISRSTDLSLGPRVTLMIGWWGKQVHTTPYSPSQKLPNMTMPVCDAGEGGGARGVSWPALFAPLSAKDNKQLTAHMSAIEPSTDKLIELAGPVWEDLGEANHGCSSGADSAKPELLKLESQVDGIECDGGIVFVGNWFLRDENEINDEIIMTAAAAAASIGGGGSANTVEGDAAASAAEGWMSLEDLAKLRG
jgi:hypothetical protein